MLILGIETSCDETAAAIVEDGVKIIANIVASSQELHIKTKGVIPEVAAREQVKCIIPVLKETLRRSDLRGGPTSPEIDAIAITVGPGLIGSLLVGVETAKTLAYVWNKPIIPINHLIGHIYTNFVNPYYLLHTTSYFPTIVLIVSGGHTELLLMTGHCKYQWLGGTRDDAAGECFDKCARILGLPYPGGPSIEKILGNKDIKILRKKAVREKIKLPRPMIDQDNFDFSFSGLKTALINLIKNNGTMEQWNNIIPYLSSEVQESITNVLVAKTLKAARKFKVKSIILAGGVSANQRLREKFNEEIKESALKVKFFVPSPELCTDNAVGIASAAFFNFKPIPWLKITADPGLEIV